MNNSLRKISIHFLCNGVFSKGVGGGNTYFSQMARAVLKAGYRVHFLGGHALKSYLQTQPFEVELTLTDKRSWHFKNMTHLKTQIKLLVDFSRRLMGSLLKLNVIQKQDCAFAISDYWFDTIPLFLCRARCKIMYLGMMAPSLWEVIFKGRPDVTSLRLPSFYYWLSQQFSLRLFRFFKNRKVTYGHPEMRDYLLKMGYKSNDLVLVSNGIDVEMADRTKVDEKKIDLAWVGRVHPQKGIEDLLEALVYLSKRIVDFKAVIIGNSKSELETEVEKRGIRSHVFFTGLISEEEKFCVLKESRVFLMPSYYESWGIVIGEALACEIPVIAYDLRAYQSVFGDFIRKIPCFDRKRLIEMAEQEILAMRRGENYLDKMDLDQLKHSLSWESSGKEFCETIGKMVLN